MAYLALCVICTLVITLLILTAPEGWQDERGFHHGAEYRDHGVGS
ncbi:hypothetical protein [Stakelama pacifica]|uniref:Uncharacterized protein n=1 Tax=Stakelama pacifica TaxID=517720 RepID=A0A4V3BT33_9SPHN|nr:hypothetical protein [Stakelama pacifica]TDN81748.1 hypothetical protein EV664_107150 [Stakelama pacifica]GGO96457.1 hypothetical protein GCM10011329_23030 [Stakelama pacifica]